MTFLTIDVSVPAAESEEVTDDTLTAELTDGRRSGWCGCVRCR